MPRACCWSASAPVFAMAFAGVPLRAGRANEDVAGQRLDDCVRRVEEEGVVVLVEKRAL